MTERVLPAAVVFDMDGVLADTEPMHGGCFAKAFGEVGISTSLEAYRRAVTIGGSTVRDFYASLGGDPARWDELKTIKDGLLRAMMECDGALMPGVITLLEALRAARIPTALVTSARQVSLAIIIDTLKLRGYFDEIVTRQDVEFEKPHPGGFLLAAERLGVRPCDCVAMEDSPRGVLAAYRAGMKCVAIPTASTADGDFSHATVVVRSLEDVTVETLRGMFAATHDPTPA